MCCVCIQIYMKSQINEKNIKGMNNYKQENKTSIIRSWKVSFVDFKLTCIFFLRQRVPVLF